VDFFYFSLKFPFNEKNHATFPRSNVFSFAQDFKTPYEKGNGNQTTTYEEMVKFYDDLDKNFESISVVEKGKDDNGEPIRVVIFDNSKKQNSSCNSHQ
jgi:hypothetical protein